jgi:UDP-N-acetylglucosamine:LPS N-acetylglucosamine transferase
MKRILLVYFDAGGGHRSAAIALQQAIKEAGYPWEVELVNLQEVLDSIDLIKRLTGIRVQDGYNQMLRNGWTLGSTQLMRMLQGLIFLFHGQSVKLLEKQWRELRPDLVVSLVPHFNRAMYESLALASPGTPFVTVLTDIADFPPHFWIERQPQFFVCGSEKAVEQAKQAGNSDDHIFATSGMILSPRFYSYEKVDRSAERRKLGLDPERMTGLVLFGGQGARKTMLEIDRRLSASNLPIQLIFICGKNEGLVQALKMQNSGMPRWIEGFTTKVPYYMQLADFFIGKPGPGSIAEAVAMRLPVIVERNAWTLPQERYNTVWVAEKQLGLVLKNFSTIAGATAQLLDPPNYARLRGNILHIHNRALFEIPEIFERILQGTALQGTMHNSPTTAAGERSAAENLSRQPSSRRALSSEALSAEPGWSVPSGAREPVTPES